MTQLCSVYSQGTTKHDDTDRITQRATQKHKKASTFNRNHNRMAYHVEIQIYELA